MWPLALCSLFSNLPSRAAFRDLMASIMWTLVSRLLCSDFFSKFASRDTILIRIEFCNVEKVVHEWYTAPTTTATTMVTVLDSKINRAFGIQLLSNFLGIPNLWSSVHWWLITTVSWVSMFKTGSSRKLKKKKEHTTEKSTVVWRRRYVTTIDQTMRVLPSHCWLWNNDLDEHEAIFIFLHACTSPPLATVQFVILVRNSYRRMISEGVCSIREAGSFREEECKAEGTKSHFVFSFRDPPFSFIQSACLTLPAGSNFSFA